MMLRSLLKPLTSLKFTAVLIAGLSLIFLLGVIIPQKDLLGKDLYLQWKEREPALVSFLEAIKFTTIYVSPLTVTLWMLFFLNLAVIMVNRVPSVVRRCRGEAFPVTVDSIEKSREHAVIEAPRLNIFGRY